MCDEDRD
jgi:hypothetical protein